MGPQARHERSLQMKLQTGHCSAHICVLLTPLPDNPFPVGPVAHGALSVFSTT